MRENKHDSINSLSHRYWEISLIGHEVLSLVLWTRDNTSCPTRDISQYPCDNIIFIKLIIVIVDIVQKLISTI